MIAVAACIGNAPAANAQAPMGSATLTPAAVAESLAVLRQLDSAVRTQPGDAASWHRLGLVAWALYERDRTPPSVGGLDWTTLGRKADTSLRIAAQLEPSNVKYQLAAGRYLLASGVSITRTASHGFFDAALDAARTGSDKSVHADAAVEAGRVHWRRYDALAHRWIGPRLCIGSQPVDTRWLIPTAADSSLREGMNAVRVAKSEHFNGATPLPFDAAGELDYTKAEALFREAFNALPSFERAYRQLAMLFAERTRWADLAAIARTRIRSAPGDAWAWMTLGLASHRQGDARTAATAFDSAMIALPAEERRRLDRLERILPLGDSARYANADAATRTAIQRLYWLSADPLWSNQDAEPRIEFLARVTFAELRWTVEELGARGADTDRGEVYIRLGPPDLVVSFGPPPTPPPMDVCTLWVYDAGYIFQFEGYATFGTAKHSDEGMAAALLESSPARWDNLALPTIDSMAVQAVRFRAAADSVDFFLATAPPVAAINKSAEVAGAVRADYWLLAGGTVLVARDSVVPVAAGPRVYSRRVRAGNYVFRTEVTATGSRVAGRAAAPIVAGADAATGFAMTGFGMSDVLLASSAESPRGTARRWSDLTITPIVGAAGNNSDLSLVWENYDLGADGNAARYTVTMLLVRERSLAGRIAARLTRSGGSRAQVVQGEDRVAIEYERSVPHAPVILDNISLSLGQTPAGRYRLTLQITDRVTARVTSRTIPLVVE